MENICREKERCVTLAEYLIDNSATVRSTAGHFGVSKSTVHKDVTERLMSVNPILASEVHKVLSKNKAERHIRGGEATRQKYCRERNRKDMTK